MGIAFAACVADRYVIGTYRRGADGGGGGPPPDGGGGGSLTCTTASSCRFAADLDRSGASHLTGLLTLPSGAVTAALRYRGEHAAPDEWSGDSGSVLPRASGAAQTALPAPFTDGTGAVGLAVDAVSYAAGAPEPGTVAGDDFVIEVVLRAAAEAPVVSKAAGGTGWSLATDTGGTLGLDLSDGARTVRVSSEALVDRAWYHCLFWITRAAGGRADCNGRVGAPVDLAGLASLGAAGNLTVGGAASAGAATDGIQLALFQLFRAAPGTLGAAAGWQAVSRRRFAQLTGVFPGLAGGTALPAENLRDSLAYLDIQRQAGGARRLFLVGPNWPRITCRTDAAGTRDCGYLSEPQRSRVVAGAPSAWTATELAVSSGDVVFVDGQQRMESLVPSVAASPHALTRRGTFSPAGQSLSFFAHAGAGHLLGASVGALGTAVFDVQSGRVVFAPNDVDATIEDWGNGIFRCAYNMFNPPGGPVDYRVMLLNDAAAETFAGDGVTVHAHVSGMQLDVGQTYPGSLMPANAQAADRLTFVGSDGNLPSGGVGSLQLRVLLPAGRRRNDQAIVNINKGGAYEDQINLFVVASTGTFEYWGLAAGTSRWTIRHSATAVDGLRHSVAAEWGGTAARVWVDGVLASRNSPDITPAVFAMDRIDVAFSLHSSTHLQGLVAGLQVTGP